MISSKSLSTQVQPAVRIQLEHADMVLKNTAEVKSLTLSGLADVATTRRVEETANIFRAHVSSKKPGGQVQAPLSGCYY